MYQRAVLLSLPKAQSIDIEFTDIVYEARTNFRSPKKQILKGISGTFKSGELTGIMGPSGAGKSTLLNILTGFERRNWKGEIEYIGNEGKHTWKEYRKQSCYIQQEDKMHPLFIVSEVMWMAAELKVGNSLSKKAKEMLIDDVLENLDLIKTKQTKCELLSGGQKKRLSIALELVDNPPVMFLDEPTTGLDSLSSTQCIRLLQNLAKAGRTIVCTIHQPSAAIYEMFDNVYLLADGRCMYEGATKNTVDYFAGLGLYCPKYHNPADYMVEVISKEYGDFNDQLATLASNQERSWRLDASKMKKETCQYNENKATVLIQAPSEFHRFFVLLNRCLVQLFRDWTATHLKLIMHLSMGIMLGLLFTDAGQDASKTLSNVGFLFVSAIYLVYTNMMPAIHRLPSEIPTLKRERFNNWYQLRTYYLATLVCSIPIQILSSFIYVFPAYFLSRQLIDVDRFLMFLLVASISALIAESFGILVASMMNPINGTFIGAIITCTMLILAGILAIYSHMPRVLYYISYASYIKYSVHALVETIYGFNRDKLFCSEIYCHYGMPEVIMTELSMQNGRFWIDIVVLLSNYLGFRVFAYCMLKKKLSKA